MSEEEQRSTPVSKDSNISLLFTKDGQTYFVDNSGGLESRNAAAAAGTAASQELDAGNVLPLDAEDPDEESDVLDTSDPRDSAASPEELNDEDAFGDGENVTKTCTYEGCTETTTQVAKQRKPWMCKKHRNKMYKDKYKKKKSDQAMSSGKLDDGAEERPVSVTKQRLGDRLGDRPARPSLIEQVLNQKRLSLLRSPEVVSFLQQQQRLLTQQSRTAVQQTFQGC
ncbi:regulatory factor X-associated protein [Scleropages formosus]|uniref:Regulatory factor X-associated protein n=1 Tax=Scleropages formosus TaxID=113540 RepID=A0A8C9WHC6_SCLFO|nr:regulatory factor X-associated protein [Scleropages formosus]